MSHTSSPTIFRSSWIPAFMPCSVPSCDQSARRPSDARKRCRRRNVAPERRPGACLCSAPHADQPRDRHLPGRARVPAPGPDRHRRRRQPGRPRLRGDRRRPHRGQRALQPRVARPGATITLSFAVDDGVARRSTGSRPPAPPTVAANELSQAIIGAVVDEHALEHRRRRDPLPRHEAGHAAPSPEAGSVTRRRRLSGDWSLRRPGREGPARVSVPIRRSAQTCVPGKIRGPPLQSTDAAPAAAAAALRRHRRWRAGLGGVTAVVIRDRDDAQERERRALGRARTGRPPRDRLRRPGDRRARVCAHRARRRSSSPTPTAAPGPRELDPRSSGRARHRRRCSTQLRAGRRGRCRPGAGTAPSARSRSATRRAAPQAAADAVANGTAKTLFDRVRASLGALGTPAPARGRRRGQPPRQRPRPPHGLFVAIAVVAIVGAVVAAFAHPPLGHAPDRRASPDEVRRVRGGALDSPIRIAGPPELAALALDVDAMRGRIRQQLRRVRAFPPGGRAERRGRAHAALRARARCRADSRRLDGRRARSAPPKAWSPATATTCSSPATGEIALDRRRHRRARRDRGDPRAALQGDAAHRAHRRARSRVTRSTRPPSMLGDMGAEVFLTAFVAVIDTDDGRVRYANAGHPPAYRRGRRRRRRRSARPVRSSACWRRDGRPPRRSIGPRRQPLRLHRRAHRDPQRATTSSSAPSASSSCCRVPAATRRRRS